MEQFRRIGEVLGGMKALMVLRDDIQINQRQCCLLLDIFTLAFKTISEEIRQNLKLEEKNTKWTVLELPLRELYRTFKEGEMYVKACLDTKNWWVKAINLHQNKDCVEFLIHNLLSCFPAVIEAIEVAGEISGQDTDEMQKKKHVLDMKYQVECNDAKVFLWKFGKQYLVSRELCTRFRNVLREDRWLLVESMKEKVRSGTKNEQQLGNLLLEKISGFCSNLFHSSILLGSKDYHVRRRLGEGGKYKEIHWLGESFCLRHLFGEVDSCKQEITSLLSLSHPHIVQYLSGFYEDEKKECFLVMELMNKDLNHFIKEICGPRRRIPFPHAIAVDIMLQIARGMGYLHSRNIFHGNLNTSCILLKSRPEGYLFVKVSGYGLCSVSNDGDPCIWYAPEVLAEQEEGSSASTLKFTEKADVYSFGMICFQILTGKIPFEDSHLQGEKTSRNIRSGERPLFPFSCPKFLVNLTRRCWQADPAQRPSFSSIARILRYAKKFLVVNTEEVPSPPVDFCDLELGLLKKFSGKETSEMAPVYHIPFEMFAYRQIEKERTYAKVRKSIGMAAASFPDNESEDYWLPSGDLSSICSDIAETKVTFLKKPTRLNDNRILGNSEDARSICSEIAEKKVNLNRSTHAKIVSTPGGRRSDQSPKSAASVQCRRSVSMSTGKQLRWL